MSQDSDEEKMPQSALIYVKTFDNFFCFILWFHFVFLHCILFWRDNEPVTTHKWDWNTRELSPTDVI